MPWLGCLGLEGIKRLKGNDFFTVVRNFKLSSPLRKQIALSQVVQLVKVTFK